MAEPAPTIEETLRRRFDDLTRVERQIAMALLEDYPVSGLCSITALAQAADVSTPSVLRLVHKLGFDGFGAFQEALKGELSARMSGPIDKRALWSAEAGGGHILNRFAAAIEGNLTATLAQIDAAAFDTAAARLADPGRHVFVTGGRITRGLADYLFTHLQVVRPGVTQLGTAPGVWPHYLLDMVPGDIVVVFDIRRYETVLLRLAEMAHGRGAEILLFTDQWGSPVGRIATHRFSARVEAPSAWDSGVVLMMLIEALVAAVQDGAWERSRDRMEALEAIFDQTRLFRKFT